MICTGVRVGFEQATYAFPEDSGTSSANVALGGDLEREVTLNVSTISGTATGQA